MTTLAELVELEPDPTHGHPIQIPAVAGVWRWVVELADTTAGVDIEWFDITDWYVGDRYQRGADLYRGRYRAALVTVQLQIDDSDLLAPWGLDTTELFGTNVELDAGLLMRAALARVVSGVTVEWHPIWTGRVETWGDASFARGQIRVHEITVVDTIADLANVPVDIDTAAWNDWYEDFLLPAANWPFGVDIYGDTGAPDLPAAVGTALDLLHGGADPLGLVARTRRNGRLIIYPAPWDTTNTARWPNPLLDVYPDGLVFSYSPDFTDIEYIADDDQAPFGVQRTSLGIVNTIVATFPGPTVYPVDDPVSQSKFGVKPLQLSWMLENEPAVDQLLVSLANASVQALPLRTTIDHEGFFPALAMIDHLDPVIIEHATRDSAPVVTVAGTVRNIIEERTFRSKAGSDYALSWQSTVQVDITSTTVSEALLPVEDLAPIGAPSYEGATFGWANPTQPNVTPTDIQIRIVERSLIWNDIPYGGVGLAAYSVHGLDPSTAYTFQVRLIRRVDGIATHVSPIREVVFTTAAPVVPIPVPDGTDTDAEIPEDDPECDLEVELQENDGTGWDTVDTFTGAELTDNGDGTFRLTTPIPNSFFNEESMYRFRSSCDGATWQTGPEFDPPDDWADPCTTPPALADPPFDDADLLVYVPKICSPDTITEAVSGLAGVHGDALEAIVAGVGDPTERALLALADPLWSDSPGGMLAYGECPQIIGHTGDKTLLAKVNIVDPAFCTLGEVAGVRLGVTPDGSDWKARAYVAAVGGEESCLSDVLDINTPTHLALTYEQAIGELKVYVEAVEQNAVDFGVARNTINAPPAWRVGAPPESWITDFALFDRLLDPSEMPGYVAPVTVTINQKAGQADPAYGSAAILYTIVFSEAVTGFAAADVTLSGTAGGTLAKSLSGSGATYELSVTGMASVGTVIASIAAAVCTSVANGTPNSASTSTDNTVTWGGASQVAAAILALSPLGYWKLNEAPSNNATAVDSSGNGRNGTYKVDTGGAFAQQAGPDGVNYVDVGNSTGATYIAIPDNNVWSISTAPGLTVVAIIKPDSVAGTTRQMIVTKGGNLGTDYEWGFDANSVAAARLSAGVNGTPGNALQNESVNSILTTAWQVVAFTTPNASYNTRMSLYRNGVALTETQGAVNNSNAYANGASQVWIGWRQDAAASQWFKGGMAHVAIFAGELNSTQIGTIMSAADAEGWY